MMDFKKQFRGYNKTQVDMQVSTLEEKISKLETELSELKTKNEEIEKSNSILQHRVNIQEKTNEEIARLALKEASELIDKAKRNANMILTESLEYVRNLSDEMSDFKSQAVEFRSSVVKMSKDLIETIDNSEVYNLIYDHRDNKDDKNDERDS
ncbi:MAG: DivIVA domain-containing protein [Thomasclavelia sp.]|jgi:cell division initiation protein|nr:DivIVA domain-containing protein [Thomasclavelia sp.]